MTLILVKLGFLRLQKTDPVVVNKKFAKKKKKERGQYLAILTCQA